ncbi:LOW QUALITY PROTEIN: hypothetical protein QTO34_014697 [Cnephaeus nilssonii]|uniref:BRCT domain-containing protein n=1 Tax=Cnephaeus nilssonii TaxID=3371016 RepID=A0AA40I6U8_CNENI|nr:LOW QUALITY PROTEIN: hypothetical protein QTO34_014697 [Eptesicus nilssonii]
MADNSLLTCAGRQAWQTLPFLILKLLKLLRKTYLMDLLCMLKKKCLKVETRVVLVQEAGKQEELIKALKTIKIMDVPVIKIKESCPGKSDEKLIKSVVNMMESVEEYESLDSPEFENVFIVMDFQDPVFTELYKTDCRVIGPPVVLNCAQKGEMVTLVHHMGGVIRKDFNSKVTHLVANCTQGEKFRIAVSLGTPIMKPEWIYKAWERRNEQDFCASADDFRNEFKVPPFQDCILSFLGFSDEEKTNMEEMTEMQGGSYLQVGDERCTHLIVEENTVKELPFEPSKKLYVVKQEAMVLGKHSNGCPRWRNYANTPELKKSVSLLSLSTPNSNRKRRRLKETLAQLSRETDLSPFLPRPSAEHSLSIGSLLDISNTPESSINYGETPKSCTKSSKNSTPVPSKQSARWQVAKELYQTESNYVNILATIIQAALPSIGPPTLIGGGTGQISFIREFVH